MDDSVDLDLSGCIFQCYKLQSICYKYDNLTQKKLRPLQ